MTYCVCKGNRFRCVELEMAGVVRIALIAAFLCGCARSTGPASPETGYGYEYNEPLTETDEVHAARRACERGGCELATPPGRLRVDL